MKKIIFSFCALMAFMNAEAQVLEVWMSPVANQDGYKVLYCEGPEFSAEVYTQTDGYNSVDVKKGDIYTDKLRNKSATSGRENGQYYYVRVYKANTSVCLFGSVPTQSQGIYMGHTKTIGGKKYKVIWAPWNLGANNDTDAGCFFSWGELIQDGYAYDNVGKHQMDNNDKVVYLYDEAHCVYKPTANAVLDKDHDIAYQWWGNNGGEVLNDGTLVGAWRIPTYDELNWLADARTMTHFLSHNTVWNGNTFINIFGNSVNDYRVTSRTESNVSLRFPRNGCYVGSSVDGGLFGDDSKCFLLSNTCDKNGNPQTLVGYQNYGTEAVKMTVEKGKYAGFNIRPVMLVLDE